MLSRDEAAYAVRQIDQALQRVSSQRSHLGALQNRLEHTLTNLMNASENLTNAASRIEDADLAREMMALTAHQIIAESAQKVLAATKIRAHAVLELLQQNLAS